MRDLIISIVAVALLIGTWLVFFDRIISTPTRIQSKKKYFPPWKTNNGKKVNSL